MLNLSTIEIVMGLIFIYLLLSILVTVLNEIFVTIISLRGKILKKAIIQILTEKDLIQKFYSHPLIKKFSKGKKIRPSYISKEIFSKVLIDSLNGYKNSDIIKNVKDSLNKLPKGSEIRKIIETLINDSENNITKFKENIENWFNEVMDRVKGWYIRKNKIIVFTIGMVITIILNADTIHIAKKVSDDNSARIKLAELAIVFVNAESNKNIYSSDSLQIIDQPVLNDTAQLNKLDSLMNYTYSFISEHLTEVHEVLGLGWNSYNQEIDEFEKSKFYFWLLKIFGWLLTATAISLGSAFWFDLLQKFVKLRGTGNTK